MPINDVDNPHKTGGAEFALAFFNVVLCFLGSIVVATMVTRVTDQLLGNELVPAPRWVLHFAHVYLRAEWLTFLFGATLHNRIINRAIRFGTLNSKVYRASLLWPLLLSCSVAVACSLAFRYAYVDIPYYLAPQGAQLIVWMICDSSYEAFFKYAPDLPTPKEIERGFSTQGGEDGLR